MQEDLIDDVLTFNQVTKGIRVAVQSYYLSEQSKPDDQQFVWAYRIKITNERNASAQLMSRHWIITNGLGKVQEVHGEGVIGEQPVINPGESFVYTSGTPLTTPTGFMRGSYDMQESDGTLFTVDIPTFSLDSPHMSLHIN